MANFFAVFGRQSSNVGAAGSETTFKSAKLLPQTTAGHANVESAKIVKLEAGSVAEAQEAIANIFPGQNTGTPVIVTEAQFKES